MDQSYSLNPAWLTQTPDKLELSGIGSMTTALGHAQMATNRNLAQPFIDANLQGLQSNVADTQLKNQEYASQPFVNSRLMGANADAAKAQGVIDQTPMETAMKRDQLRASPFKTDAEIAAAKDQLNVTNDAPRVRAAQRMATIKMQVDAVKDPMQKAYVYAEAMHNLINGTTDPNQKAYLESELADPKKGMQHLESAYNEHVNNVAQQQKLAQEDRTGYYKLEAARIEAAAKMGAAKEAHKDYDKMEMLELKKRAYAGEPMALHELANKAQSAGDVQMYNYYKDAEKKAQFNKVERASAGVQAGNQFKREILGTDGNLNKDGDAYVGSLLDQYAPRK